MRTIENCLAYCLLLLMFIVLVLGSGCTIPIDNRFPVPVAGVGVLRVQYPFHLYSIDGKPGPNGHGETGLYDINLEPGPHVLRLPREVKLNVEAGCVYRVVTMQVEFLNQPYILTNRSFYPYQPAAGLETNL